MVYGILKEAILWCATTFIKSKSTYLCIKLLYVYQNFNTYFSSLGYVMGIFFFYFTMCGVFFRDKYCFCLKKKKRERFIMKTSSGWHFHQSPGRGCHAGEASLVLVRVSAFIASSTLPGLCLYERGRGTERWGMKQGGDFLTPFLLLTVLLLAYGVFIENRIRDHSFCTWHPSLPT